MERIHQSFDHAQVALMQDDEVHVAGEQPSPAEDVARQIRAAGGQPVERTGRFAARG